MEVKGGKILLVLEKCGIQTSQVQPCTWQVDFVLGKCKLVQGKCRFWTCQVQGVLGKGEMRQSSGKAKIH